MDQAAKDASGEPEAAVGVEEAIRMVRNAREEVDATILRHNSPSQHVNVGDKGHGDKVAIWVLIAASALVLGINIGQSSQISDLRAQVRRLEDYQMTTFMLVPKLREEVEKTIQKKESK